MKFIETTWSPFVCIVGTAPNLGYMPLKIILVYSRQRRCLRLLGIGTTLDAGAALLVEEVLIVRSVHIVVKVVASIHITCRHLL